MSHFEALFTTSLAALTPRFSLLVEIILCHALFYCQWRTPASAYKALPDASLRTVVFFQAHFAILIKPRILPLPPKARYHHTTLFEFQQGNFHIRYVFPLQFSFPFR